MHGFLRLFQKVSCISLNGNDTFFLWKWTMKIFICTHCVNLPRTLNVRTAICGSRVRTLHRIHFFTFYHFISFVEFLWQTFTYRVCIFQNRRGYSLIYPCKYHLIINVRTVLFLRKMHVLKLVRVHSAS